MGQRASDGGVGEGAGVGLGVGSGLGVGVGLGLAVGDAVGDGTGSAGGMRATAVTTPIAMTMPADAANRTGRGSWESMQRILL